MRDDYSTHDTTVIVGVLTAIGILALALRFIARWAILKKYGIEDFFIGAALVRNVPNFRLGSDRAS
jgi:hypothetical protein